MFLDFQLPNASAMCPSSYRREWMKYVLPNPSLYPHNLPPRPDENQLWSLQNQKMTPNQPSFNFNPSKHLQEPFLQEKTSETWRKQESEIEHRRYDGWRYGEQIYRRHYQDERVYSTFGKESAFYKGKTKPRFDFSGLFSVFVDNLPSDMNRSWLKSLFFSFGVVVDTHIPYRSRTGSVLKYGFVRYKHREEALKAIGWLNGSDLRGSLLVVQMARGKPEKYKCSRSFFQKVKAKSRWIPKVKKSEQYVYGGIEDEVGQGRTISESKEELNEHLNMDGLALCNSKIETPISEKQSSLFLGSKDLMVKNTPSQEGTRILFKDGSKVIDSTESSGSYTCKSIPVQSIPEKLYAEVERDVESEIIGESVVDPIVESEDDGESEVDPDELDAAIKCRNKLILKEVKNRMNKGELLESQAFWVLQRLGVKVSMLDVF